MKCQHANAKYNQDPLARSHQEFAACTGLGPVSDLITRHRNSVFGHIARLSEDTPAHQALLCHVDLTLSYLPGQSWKRRPGRPKQPMDWPATQGQQYATSWPVEKIHQTRGHSGVTLWSSTTTRWRRRRQGQGRLSQP